MGWTKRQLVYQAFESIGMAHYAFDLSAEELQGALRQLEAMLGNWNAKGIRLGYALSQNPDLDDDSNLPDSANEAVYANLAIRVAVSFGKTVSLDHRKIAYSAYKVLLARAAKPPMPMELPADMPSGAGNKHETFISPGADSIDAGADDTIEFN